MTNSILNLVTNLDGSQSLTVENVNITFNNYDPTTGAASMTITAAQGFSTLPGVLQGQPGLPPIFQISMEQVAYGTALPTTNPAVDVVDPGGPGQASTISLTFYVQQGEPGTTGDFLLQSAEDVIGLGEGLLGQVLSIVGINPLQFGPAFTALGGYGFPSTINPTSSVDGPQRTLATIPMRAESYKWMPLVSGQAIVDATDGTAQVYLVARLNNASSGEIIGTGLSVPGQTTPIILSSGPPEGSASGYGMVAANTTATVYINAEQQAGTVAAFTTAVENCVGFGCAALMVS